MPQTPDVVPWEKLFDAARQVQSRAHAPYSHFPVGAAVLAADGRIFSGCNVENVSYGLSLCAERSAVARGVAEGAQRIIAVAIVANTEEPCPPCGMCRQVLAEFGDGAMQVRSCGIHGKEQTWTLKALLPFAFDSAMLEHRFGALDGLKAGS